MRAKPSLSRRGLGCSTEPRPHPGCQSLPWSDHPVPASLFGLVEPLYTTNAVESLNAQLRKVTKKKGAFSTAEAGRKVLYLALQRASARWTRPVQDWSAALNHLAVVFEGQVPL